MRLRQAGPRQTRESETRSNTNPHSLEPRAECGLCRLVLAASLYLASNTFLVSGAISRTDSQTFHKCGLSGSLVRSILPDWHGSGCPHECVESATGVEGIARLVTANVLSFHVLPGLSRQAEPWYG